MKENKDNQGNDIKKAALTNVYKYSKPVDESVGYLNENDNIPTPQPTILPPPQPYMIPPMPLMHPTQFQQVEQPPIKTVIMKSKPKRIIIHNGEYDDNNDDDGNQQRRIVVQGSDDDLLNQTRIIKMRREPSQKQIVQVVQREPSPKQQIVRVVEREPSSRQIVQVVRRDSPKHVITEQNQNSQIVVIKKQNKQPFSLQAVAQNLIKKVRGKRNETVKVVNRPSNYIIEDDSPKNQVSYVIEKQTRAMDVRSPSHIPVIAIEPHNERIQTPKVIKISRNEMVARRTPASTSNSRAQLIESSDKRPVILNKNYGENLNAFQ